MQYPFSGCGLLSKKQYAASAAIILMMKLFTDLCLEYYCPDLWVSVIHIGTSETERDNLPPVVADQV